MKLKHLLYIPLLLIGFAACQEEDNATLSEGKEKMVTIQLEIPGTGNSEDMATRGAPSTYALPTFESKIDNITVLSFIPDPASENSISRGTFFYQAPVKYTPGQSSFNVQLYQHTKRQTLKILVNLDQDQINAINQLVPNVSTESDLVRNELVLKKEEGWDASDMRIPMWGQLLNQLIDAEYTAPTVRLTRMLAKINITNKVNTSIFKLEEAYLYNPRKSGHITSIEGYWDETNWVAWAATTPTGSLWATGKHLPPYTTNNNKFENSIYTFETSNREKTIDGGSLHSTCIVVGGRYNNSAQRSYYRIDFKNYTTNELYNLLRNHTYNIIINAVGGAGAEEADDAFRGVSTINATVEVWNNVPGNVIVDSDKHFTVSQQAFFLDATANTLATTDNKLTIETTDPRGWQIENKPSWLTITNEAGVAVTEGAADTPVTLSLNTSADYSKRAGTFIVKSGNINYTVIVAQDKCGHYGAAYTQRIGVNDYRTHRYGNLCWMVENLKEGTPKYDTYSQPQVLGYEKGDRGYYYLHPTSTSSCPSGWRLPTGYDKVSNSGAGTDAKSLLDNYNSEPGGARWWIDNKYAKFAGQAYQEYSTYNMGTWYSLTWKDWDLKTSIYTTFTKSYEHDRVEIGDIGFIAFNASGVTYDLVRVRYQPLSISRNDWFYYYSRPVRCVKNE